MTIPPVVIRVRETVNIWHQMAHQQIPQVKKGQMVRHQVQVDNSNSRTFTFLLCTISNFNHQLCCSFLNTGKKFDSSIWFYCLNNIATFTCIWAVRSRMLLQAKDEVEMHLWTTVCREYPHTSHCLLLSVIDNTFEQYHFAVQFYKNILNSNKMTEAPHQILSKLQRS